MKKKVVIIVLTAVLLLLVVPVIFAQTSDSKSREWSSTISLNDLAYEEVSFYNQEQALSLAGMLFTPQGSRQSVNGSAPAVIFIHGSAPSNRENRWFLTITQHLLENGVIVFNPDKRGAGNSEGDGQTASFQDLATDTLAAVHYLQGRQDLSISHIGLIGSSQGGHISPMIANQSQDIAFIIDLSGTAVPIREQLLYEENYNLREMGFLPGLSNLIAYPAAWSIREVRQKELWSAIGDFDPLPHWQELEIEALVLYGKEDTNIPAIKSEMLLQSLNKPNITVKLYEGSGHNLETPIGQGDNIIRQEALQDMSNFILSSPPNP